MTRAIAQLYHLHKHPYPPAPPRCVVCARYHRGHAGAAFRLQSFLHTHTHTHNFVLASFRLRAAKLGRAVEESRPSQTVLSHTGPPNPWFADASRSTLHRAGITEASVSPTCSEALLNLLKSHGINFAILRAPK